MHRFAAHFRQLLQRQHIDDPYAAAVGAGDQLALARMHDQIVHRNIGQIALQAVPVAAAIERHVHAAVGADIQHVGIDGVFADHVDRFVWQAGGDVLPALAEVVAREHPRSHVVIAIAVQGEVGAALVERRCDHPADPLLRQVGVDVRPVHAAVVGHVHMAVVGADPQQAEALGRFADGGDGGVRHVAAFLAGGQIGADRRPGDALVERAEQLVRTVIDDVLVVRRQQDRGIPVVAQLRIAQARMRSQFAIAAGAVALVVAELIAGVEGRVVAGVHLHVHAVAAADPRPPVELGEHIARAFPRAVVLQSAVDVVRVGHVGHHRIELADRVGSHRAEMLAAIVADVQAAVVADDHPQRIGRVDPQRVVIHMDIGIVEAGPALAAVA